MIKSFYNVQPVYQKETMTSSRTARLTVIVMAFNLVLALVGLVQLLLMVRNSSYYGEMNYSSLLRMYMLVASFEAAFLLFIVPALTAGSISGERERQTLDLLLCTRLRPIDIIIGKLLSCLSTVFVLIISSLPVLSLVYIYGGIGLKDLAALFVCMVVTTLFVGSISIFFSALMKKTTMATVLSYLSVVFLAVGTYLILVLVFNFYSLAAPESLHPEKGLYPWNLLFLLNPAMTFYSLFSQQIGGFEDMNFMAWFNSFVITDHLEEAWWVWCSCLVQLILSALFIWLVSYVISPLRRKD